MRKVSINVYIYHYTPVSKGLNDYEGEGDYRSAIRILMRVIFTRDSVRTPAALGKGEGSTTYRGGGVRVLFFSLQDNCY